MTLPALSDPARAGQEDPGTDGPGTEALVPLRPGDIRVKQAVDILIGRADYERERRDIHARLMLEWGCSKNGVEQAFTEAGRFLRIQRTPELLLEQGLAELRAIATSTAEDAPAVAVAAWKTILDRIEKLVERAASKPPMQGGATAHASAVAALQSPTPELAAVLTEALSAPSEALVGVVEGCGWRR